MKCSICLSFSLMRVQNALHFTPWKCLPGQINRTLIADDVWIRFCTKFVMACGRVSITVSTWALDDEITAWAHHCMQWPIEQHRFGRKSKIRRKSSLSLVQVLYGTFCQFLFHFSPMWNSSLHCKIKRNVWTSATISGSDTITNTLNRITIFFSSRKTRTVNHDNFISNFQITKILTFPFDSRRHCRAQVLRKRVLIIHDLSIFNCVQF